MTSKYTQQAQGAAQDASKSAQQTATNASQQAQEPTQGSMKPVQDKAAGYTERAKQATQEGVESAKNTEAAKEGGKAVDSAASTASDYADAAKKATVGDAAAAGMPLQAMQHSCTLKLNRHSWHDNCQTHQAAAKSAALLRVSVSINQIVLDLICS